MKVASLPKSLQSLCKDFHHLLPLLCSLLENSGAPSFARVVSVRASTRLTDQHKTGFFGERHAFGCRRRKISYTTSVKNEKEKSALLFHFQTYIHPRMVKSRNDFCYHFVGAQLELRCHAGHFDANILRDPPSLHKTTMACSNKMITRLTPTKLCSSVSSAL